MSLQHVHRKAIGDLPKSIHFFHRECYTFFACANFCVNAIHFSLLPIFLLALSNSIVTCAHIVSVTKISLGLLLQLVAAVCTQLYNWHGLCGWIFARIAIPQVTQITAFHTYSDCIERDRCFQFLAGD